MHKARYNSLALECLIEPKGPLLVKSGTVALDPTLPDMQFVRTFHPELGETIYIPGSSLKGAIRAFVEGSLRTAGLTACDVFGDDSCGKKFDMRTGGREGEEILDSATVYRESCYACKVFGNTRLKARVAMSDAYPTATPVTEVRQSVAISRLTGAVAHGPYDLEVLVSGGFRFAVRLENFEVWQIGLLALALRAMNDGFLRLGFGKNRGFGEVSVLPAKDAVVEQFGDVPETELYGVGRYVCDEERERYGFRRDDGLTGLPKPRRTGVMALYARRFYTSETWEALAENAVAHLQTALVAPGG